MMLTAIFVTILMCTACFSKELDYNTNLGYNFNYGKNKNVTFNVYHSNTKDHSWELIKSFSCTLKPGHYNDVKAGGKKGKVVFTLQENTYTKTENHEEYNGRDISSFEYGIEGFDGWMGGYKEFSVKNIEGEQLARLYPIPNPNNKYNYVTYNEDVSLNKPYDTGDGNIDNVLITVRIKR